MLFLDFIFKKKISCQRKDFVVKKEAIVKIDVRGRNGPSFVYIWPMAAYDFHVGGPYCPIVAMNNSIAWNMEHGEVEKGFCTGEGGGRGHLSPQGGGGVWTEALCKDSPWT